MSNRNLTDEFVETLYTLHSRPLPPEIELEARKCLMDETSTMLAGAALQRERLTEFLDYFTGEDATVVGLGRKASLQNAALANGIIGHSYDFDDGHRFSTVHLGSTTIPPVLAVCEKEGLTMQDLIRGVVIGYETSIRLGRCIQPSHRARGFHSSGTVGAVGAAMGVASALNFTKEQFKAAMSAALSSAGGLNEMMENVSTMKPYNVGRAAHDGITAAYIARVGFRGPYDAMVGTFGFLHGACDEYDASVLSLETDDGYHITGGYHKPYASCRHTHGAVYAAYHAFADNGLKLANVDHVEIRMYGQGVKGHTHTAVPSAGAAKMSTPFCVALCLKTGKIGIDSFTEETLHDPEILALSEKVQVEPDEEMSSWVPKKRASNATVVTKDGKRYFFAADYAIGEPELPMTVEDFRQKLEDLGTAAGRSKETIAKLADMIMNYNGKAADFAALLA